RVAKPEPACMEGLPGEALEQSVTQATLRRVRRQLLFPAPAVGGIPDDRVADVAQMDPDLVRASRFQLELEQRGRAEALDHGPARGGRLAAPGHHRHALAPARIAADRLLDQPAGER